MIISVKTLRRLIGILAMLFPFMLMIGGAFSGTGVQTSLSAYYWTTAGILFSGFIMTFGIILSVYNGYDKADRAITAIASGMMFLVALFPCKGGTFYLFQFIPPAATAIVHFVAAGVGFSLMGVMSFYQFTKGGSGPAKIRRNRLYRACGVVIFSSITVGLVVNIIPALSGWANASRFWFAVESLIPIAFGLSWFVKSGAIFQD